MIELLSCPKKLHNIYKFEVDDKLYIADIDQYEVLEIDRLTWDILSFCSSFTTDEIIENLSEKYPENEIVSCLQTLKEVEESGLLFGAASQKPVKQSDRMKILAPKSRVFGKDMKWTALGGIIAHNKLLEALTEYADVYVTQETDNVI